MTASGRRISRSWSAVAAIGALALLPGCYTAGLRFPSHVRRISVPVFGNETFVRGIEFELTERIRRILLERSTVGLAASDEGADASIRGRIVRVDFPVLVGGGEPRILEGSARALVEASLVDPRSGAVLATVRGEERMEFTTSLGESRESALAELMAELAWKVAQGLSQDSREEVRRADGPGDGRSRAPESAAGRAGSQAGEPKKTPPGP